jgi:hypothetical protein
VNSVGRYLRPFALYNVQIEKLADESYPAAREPLSSDRSRPPSRITAIISQNGNSYEDGLGEEPWAPPLRTYWKQPSAAIRDQFKERMSPMVFVKRTSKELQISLGSNPKSIDLTFRRARKHSSETCPTRS